MQLSKRLEQLIEYIPAGSRLVDVGTDHGYVPVEAVARGKASFAIAADVAAGPLQAAQASIDAAGLEGRVEARLGSGLQVLQAEDAVDVAIVAGMGGRLIVDILSEAEFVPGFLILQANVADSLVRQWLFEHSFAIVAETTVLEAGKFYPVIVAERSESVDADEGSDLAILVGKRNLARPSVEFLDRWIDELAHSRALLAQLKKAENTEEKQQQVNQRIRLIQEVMSRETAKCD